MYVPCNKHLLGGSGTGLSESCLNGLPALAALRCSNNSQQNYIWLSQLVFKQEASRTSLDFHTFSMLMIWPLTYRPCSGEKGGRPGVPRSDKGR